MAGISLDCRAKAGDGQFREGALFTHRGLSGPAMLQVSSYWQPGDPVRIDLLPELDLNETLRRLRAERPRAQLKTVLAEHLPRRLVERWCALWLGNPRLAEHNFQWAWASGRAAGQFV